MPDKPDLVTRLREEAEAFTGYLCSCVMMQSADEIERLRLRVADLERQLAKMQSQAHSLRRCDD